MKKVCIIVTIIFSILIIISLSYNIIILLKMALDKENVQETNWKLIGVEYAPNKEYYVKIFSGEDGITIANTKSYAYIQRIKIQIFKEESIIDNIYSTIENNFNPLNRENYEIIWKENIIKISLKSKNQLNSFCILF